MGVAQRTREIISTKRSKTAIRKLLDPPNLSAIRYVCKSIAWEAQACDAYYNKHNVNHLSAMLACSCASNSCGLKILQIFFQYVKLHYKCIVLTLRYLHYNNWSVDTLPMYGGLNNYIQKLSGHAGNNQRELREIAFTRVECYLLYCPMMMCKDFFGRAEHSEVILCKLSSFR